MNDRKQYYRFTGGIATGEILCQMDYENNIINFQQEKTVNYDLSKLDIFYNNSEKVNDDKKVVVLAALYFGISKENTENLLNNNLSINTMNYIFEFLWEFGEKLEKQKIQDEINLLIMEN